MKTCERCGDESPSVGPFRDDDTGERWARLCGGCKIKITLSPKRKARLEAEIGHALRTVIDKDSSQ